MNQSAPDERQLLLDIYRIVLESRDLPSGLSAALEIIGRFTASNVATVWTRADDAEQISLCSSWHDGDRRFHEFVESCRRQRFCVGEGMPGRVWRAGATAATHDLAIELAEKFLLAPAAAKAGLQTALAAPIMQDGAVEAVLMLHAAAAAQEDRRSVETITRIATQLGFAIRHRRGMDAAAPQLRRRTDEDGEGLEPLAGTVGPADDLLRAEISAREHIEELLHKAVREQAAIAELGQQVLGGIGLSVLMQTITALVAQTLSVPFCKILELMPGHEAFLLRAGVGWKEGLVGQAIIPAGTCSQAGYTLLCGEPVIVRNLRAETRFIGPALLLDHEVVSGISVIIGRSDRPFGVLGVHTAEEREFLPEDVHFVQAIANLLSQTIERERGEAWLQSLIDATQDAVLSIDRQGHIVLFNPAAERIFGYAAEEAIGRKVNMLMAEPYAREHDGYIAHYEATGEARAIGKIRTVTARRKSGEPFPIELSVTEIAVEREVHYAAFIRDISEKTQLQRQLVESERLAAVGNTAARIGHELANPLNGMCLTVQLLEQRLNRVGAERAEELRPTVTRLKNEIARLQKLAGEFATLSRKEKYLFRRIEPMRLIDDVVQLQAPYLAHQGIEIWTSRNADLPAIRLDADKIKQALLNLIKNAAEAMAGGGRIGIRAARAGDVLAVEVSDTGAGIPEDFDPFEPFATTKSEGTGVGLAITRQILTAHQGTISYKSVRGEGTTFRIELPLDDNRE